MKTVIIHGQNHKGSTYHIARILAEKIGGEVTEFFLPKDFSAFCVGCTNCFTKSETLCPHFKMLEPITKAMNEADVIILASPVYVYHVTGPMKVFLDHYGYQWMVHRPEERMFSKQGVCISTAAGSGTKSTNKDMADSLFFWGVGKIYKIGINVAATSWQKIGEEKRRIVEKKTTKIAKEVKRNFGRVEPSIKTKLFFNLMRMLQKRGWNEADVKYWQKRGWDQKKRPY
ncbi:MAG: flavodoxin family protein [Lachnospiraceae bacterium]|nr:flavodoxin family protein [Lachnospiraceae bacterium]